ncbi:O-antigen ligase family protein [Flavobacterium foetidum]|nr:O-antigen ligase family protein [Flavobacterium foetidum]
MPILIFAFWCLYVFSNYLINRATLIFTIYSITLYFLLIRSTTVFSTSSFKFKSFFIGIATIATIESIYCILQFYGVFKSGNKFYNVTGSWNNPNITAIFLALTFPIFLYLFKTQYKKIILTGFLSLLIALLLLKCRTAFIGIIFSAIVFYSLEYQFINWIRNPKNRTATKALSILGVLIIIPLSSQLYNAKKASADGRKFIWKVSAVMALEKPLAGHGYGFFEKEYNLHQSNYIKQGKATAEEIANAGSVIMPHNEILHNAVEGGMIGLLLILLFFGSILLTLRRSKVNQNDLNPNTDSHLQNSNFILAYAGIVSFIAMSMVNSTIQIVPAMCLCVIYTAIICSSSKKMDFFVNLDLIQNKKAFSIFSKAVIFIANLYLFSLVCGMAYADRQNKKAQLLKEAGQYDQALLIMSSLEPFLKEDPNYWKNYGDIYFQKHLYIKSLDCFKKAQMRSTLPDVYYGIGVCYERLKQYPKAVQHYETLTSLHPLKFSYRMKLLRAYLKNNETSKATILANEIIQLQPKIPSEKANRYKKICRILLNNLEKTNSIQKPTAD